MFCIFKRDPVKTLEKEHAIKLPQARYLQRTGDIVGYSRLATEADVVLKQIEKIEAQRAAEST